MLTIFILVKAIVCNLISSKYNSFEKLIVGSDGTQTTFHAVKTFYKQCVVRIPPEPTIIYLFKFVTCFGYGSGSKWSDNFLFLIVFYSNVKLWNISGEIKTLNFNNKKCTK